MSDREEREPGAGPPDGGAAETDPHVSFVDRLQARLGREVDPGIQLQDEAEVSDLGRRQGSSSTHSSGSSGRRLIEKLVDSVNLSSRYRIADEIARGGMGQILRVWDDDLRRNLAMKVMHGVARTGSTTRSSGPEEERLVRFLEEAQITGQLDHPGVVPVHDLGIDPKGRCYFTMRLVRGRELKEILKLAREQKEGWTLTRALGIVLKVCEAMAFAHSKSVIHRDLKPSNVMVGRFGETYVMDWGLARVLTKGDAVESLPEDASSLSIVRTDRRDTELEDPVSPLVTLDGDVVGTPSYMAPEQARGDLANLGPRADVYALGAILYELLTGRVPYLREGERVGAHEILSRVLNGEPEPVAKLAKDQPAELVAICEKAMARDQSQRYVSMLAVAEDIQAYLEDRVVKAYGGGAIVEIKKWVLRNKGAAAALGALLLVAAVSAVGFNLQKSRQVAELEAQEKEIKDAKDKAEDSAQQANEAKLATEVALTKAQESATAALASEGRARRSSYGANLLAVLYSLRLGDVVGAKQRLAACEEDIRGWEWSHLELECNPTLRAERATAFRGDRAQVFADGGALVAFTRPGLAEVLDFETFESVLEDPVNTVGLTGGSLFTPLTFDARSCMAVHPERRVVALFSSGDSILVRDFEADQERRLSIAGWVDGLDVAAAAPAVAGLRGIAESQRYLRTLAWSPDGSTLAAGGFDGSILLFDVQGDGGLRVLEDKHREAILGMAWGPDGRSLACVTFDGEFGLWDVQRGTHTGEREHEGPATDVVYDPRRGSFLTCGRDGAILRWSRRSGGLETTLARLGEPLQALAVRARTGLVAAVSDPEEDGQDARVHLIEPIGKINAVVGLLTSLLSKERVEIRSLSGAEEGLHAVFFGPDGLTVGAYGARGIVYLWDVEGPISRTVLGPGLEDEERRDLLNGNVRGVGWDGRKSHGALGAAIDPSGRFAATGGAEADVLLWDLETGFEIARLRGHDALVNAVAFSPDGSLLASGSHDRVVRLWNVETKSLVRVLRGHERWVDGLHFSPDGERLYSSGGESVVRVWDVASGQAIGTAGEGLARGVSSTLSADGSLLAVGSREIAVYDAITLEERLRLPRISGRVRSLAFSEDGAALWVGYSNGGTLRKWSLETEELLLEREDHAGSVVNTHVTHDGTRLLTTADDVSVFVRDAETGDVLLALGVDSEVRSLTEGPQGERVLATLEDGSSVLLETAAGDRERVQARRATRAIERARRERLRPLVLAKLEELSYPSEVRADLQSDSELDALDRRSANAILETSVDAPGYLAGRARTVAQDETSTRDQLDLALRHAEAAAELQPDDPRLEVVLGIVQVRAGLPAAGMETLTQVLERAEDDRIAEEMVGDEALLVANYHLLLAMLSVDALDRVAFVRAEVDELLDQNPFFRVRAELASLREEVQRELRAKGL